MQQVAFRESIAAERSQIREEFSKTKDGLATTRALTESVEQALAEIFARSLAQKTTDEREFIEKSLALVAIGGFARCELAPFSDVDLLFLHRSKSESAVLPFVSELVRQIWDAGFSLGQNVGSSRALIQLASKEVLPATSFLDARRLIGPAKLCSSFRTRFLASLQSGRGLELFFRIVDAVREDQQKFGATAYLLEPNVKRTPGGLRDIHMMRWAAQAIHETTDLVELEERGFLGIGDSAALDAALGFLTRVRCDLHFHADKGQDDLTRSEQVRLAREWPYENQPGRSAVEQFMADYFRHSTVVADITERFIERAKPRSLMANARSFFLGRKVMDGVSIGTGRLVVAARLRRRIAESLELTLELAEFAARYRVIFDYHLTEALRRQHLFTGNGDAPANDEPLTEEAARIFMRVLQTPGTQHQILRVLHRVGALSRVIPEFEHARCLLQFNAYHKYTVDEHTFVVLENIERFADRTDVIGRAYHGVERKDLLHLAVLLHDLGKGRDEDHSEVGKRLAEDIAIKLKLPAEDRETLCFLVHRHLLMSDLAMKRDISDPRVWVMLGKIVEDSQRLRMLYTLTCADIQGVGPGVFTQWTADLLEELYRNTLAVLGDEEDARDSVEIWERRRQELLAKHSGDAEQSRLIQNLPTGYLAEVDSAEIEEHLAVAAQLPAGDIDVLTKYRADTKTVTYTVIAREQSDPYPFSKICGGLAAHHMDVLRARIYTLGDGTVVDQFDVRDTHYFGDPTPDRVMKVESTIRKILKGELSVQDALYSSRSSHFGQRPRVMAPVGTQVSIDNSASEHCSVVDVFANNRRGLLYTVAQGLARLGLNVQYAKIATYEDEAADIFYVRDQSGQKITGHDRIAEVENALLRDVQRLIEDPRQMGF